MILCIIASDNDDIPFLMRLIIIIMSCIGIVLIFYSIGSNFICNEVMRQYEEGKVVKEYTIIDQDTTYKWIYKK